MGTTHVCMPSLCTPADEYGEMVNDLVELHHCTECVVADQMSHPYMGTTPTKVLPLSSIYQCGYLPPLWFLRNMYTV